MLVNTVDTSIRVVQQTFRHSTVLLHMPTKQTSADCALWTVSYQITHCNTLDMPDNIRSILRLEHDVTAPTTCRRTSCTVTIAHGCLSSLKAESGNLRLCQLLFRAPTSDGATMNMPYKCFTIWRNTIPRWTTSAIGYSTPCKDPYGSSSPFINQQGQHRRHILQHTLLTMRLEHAFFLSRTVPTLALQTLQLNTFQCLL